MSFISIIDAEKLLFSLKEILVAEFTNHSELVLAVFWGLLACEIVNVKDREVIQNTTLKKLKELIEKSLAD